MGRISALDKENVKPKRSKPKEAASKEDATAEENGGKAAAAAKPKRPPKSAAQKAAAKKKKEKAATKGARKALREAVKKVVKAECDEIAKKLLEETKLGNMRSASMMLSLMEKKKDKEGNHDVPSEAELLGSEEQWKDESPLAAEATSEVGEGGRETENTGNRD